ncbi:MAG: hypothetical protein SGJ27_01180 [Candidatus Melainabacteria bacterium]|nr:hypothetical protein [Candidatus Melainabacteria bacterium]
MSRGFEAMSSMGPAGSASGSNQPFTGKTINLQGVASFAALVELLNQELGTAGGKMQGQLPNGPDSFDKLMGELDLNSQGFVRKLILISQPGAPLMLRFQCAWNKTHGEGKSEIVGGVTADYFLGVGVEEVLPQGRALARYIEDIFAVLDRMVTLGHSTKLANMSIPVSQLEAFEASESNNLVAPYEGRPAPDTI